MMTVTPLWIADLHLYAWTGEINSLSLGRCKSTGSHRADKAKPQRGFCNRSHVAVLSVAPLWKRRFSELITRDRIVRFQTHLHIGIDWKHRTFFVSVTMSALGQKQTYAVHKLMSALPPKTDSCRTATHVRFGPEADIARAFILKIFRSHSDQFG